MRERKKKSSTVDETSEADCRRCGKSDHTTRECRVTYRRAWPGKHSMRLSLRTPDGVLIELETALNEEFFKRAHELMLDAMKPSAGPASMRDREEEG